MFWRNINTIKKIMIYQEIYNDIGRNIRLDVFLKNYIKNISRTKIQKLISNGSVKVDEYVVKPSYLLKGNECITVDEIIADHDSINIKKENISILFLFYFGLEPQLMLLLKGQDLPY